jgi:hypothetical protein
LVLIVHTTFSHKYALLSVSTISILFSYTHAYAPLSGLATVFNYAPFCVLRGI